MFKDRNFKRPGFNAPKPKSASIDAGYTRESLASGGWSLVPVVSSSKAHFFLPGKDSLCGKWSVYASTLAPRRPSIHADCKECVERWNQLQHVELGL